MSKLTYMENVIGQSRIGKRNRLATATTVRKTINNINKK